MKPVIRLLLCAACSMSAEVANAQSVSAQRDGMRATAIRGTVMDDTDTPVNAAIVSVDNSATIIRTNTDGKFLISGLSSGQHVLNVRAVGYEHTSARFVVKTGEVIEAEIMLLRLSTLDTSRIVGMSAARTEFEDRRARKLGYAVDSSVLNHRSDVFSALSQIPLTSVKRTNTGGVSVLIRSLAGRPCAPSPFLDGKMTSLDAVSRLPPDSFRAIELLPYETVPGKYFTSPCVGAILFWSKNAKW